MTNEEEIEFLDWIVECNFQFYKTKTIPELKSEDKSHWYLKGSPERFSSEELIKIWNGTASAGLKERWNWAKADRRDNS